MTIAELRELAERGEGYSSIMISVSALNALLGIAEAAEKYNRLGPHAAWCFQQGVGCSCGKKQLDAALAALRKKEK